ncbi:MAG: hypothetical protein K2M60_04060 [Lachnospiraceae bacterium]|nr:hypothetical protein [Lachnospiraceae bacterium]MDE6251139.1 hypothetical protein [Lachnospiraceae bacterium]
MTARKKRLTLKEKKHNAELKKELQEKGIIPPDKKKLNRKKFIDDTVEKWHEKGFGAVFYEIYLLQAVMIMCSHFDRNHRLSPEAVGAAKCLAIAMRLAELKERNEEAKTVGELVEKIRDITDA